MTPLTAFLSATVRSATPLALAALGETASEQAGVINVGLEGIMMAGAFGALVGAGTWGITASVACGALAGALIALIFALFAVRWRTDQIITGTAITLFGLGLTGTLYRVMYGVHGAALSIPTMSAWRIPVLADLPILGEPLFDQPVLTYLLYVLTPALWWWTYRTQAGLALRAVGQNPEAARAAGISPSRVQFLAIVFGGVLGGIGGVTLVVAQAGTFAEGMTAGRGFIAIAVVALGRWHPVGTIIAAVIFGAASALQFLFQAMGWHAPYQLFLALPYVLTLAALGIRGAGRKDAAPTTAQQQR